MVFLVNNLTHKPLAFGTNCGVGTSDLLRIILGCLSKTPNLPIISKGNTGMPKLLNGAIHYDATPELMSEYALLARDIELKTIGGCCGTTSKHLKAARTALKTWSVS